MATQNNYDQYHFGDFIISMLTNLETPHVPSYLDDVSLMRENASIYKTPYVTHIIHSRESSNRVLL